MTKENSEYLSHMFSISPSLGILALFALGSLSSWTLWYIWSFKVVPWLFPLEPPTYPYVIPRHAYDYFRDSHGCIAKARRHFSSTREPFQIVLAGVRHYVITSSEDAHIVYSKPSVFNFDYFLSKALSGFGVNPYGLIAFFKKRPKSETNPSGKCLAHVTEDIYKRHLLPSPAFNHLIEDHKASLEFQLSYKQLAGRYGLSNSGQVGPISLYSLCTVTMVESVQSCLFDPIIMTIDAEITRDMMDFTDDLWKLMHPTRFVDQTKARSTLKRYHETLKKYQKLPDQMRLKEYALCSNLIKEYRDYMISEDDSAAVLVMVYWAAVSNIAKLPYWMMVNILFHANLYEELRNEISPAMHGDKVDSNYLLHKCPVLKSVYLETLRLTKMDHVYRRVEQDITVGGKILRRGGTVIVSATELHQNEEIFGEIPSDFNPTRFLEQPKLANSRSFRPYGSGSTFCPGREFASQEALVFVALILQKFEVHVVGGAYKPLVDRHLLTVGLSRPSPGTDVQVSLQPRER